TGRAVESMLAVEVVNARRDFTRGPFTGRLLEQTLVVGDVEVDHGQVGWARLVGGPRRGYVGRTPPPSRPPPAFRRGYPSRKKIVWLLSRTGSDLSGCPRAQVERGRGAGA